MFKRIAFSRSRRIFAFSKKLSLFVRGKFLSLDFPRVNLKLQSVQARVVSHASGKRTCEKNNFTNNRIRLWSFKRCCRLLFRICLQAGEGMTVNFILHCALLSTRLALGSSRSQVESLVKGFGALCGSCFKT